MDEIIRILLCEDQDIVSEGIANYLNKENGIIVKKIIKDASLILAELKKDEYDIVLTDIITENKNNVLNYVPAIKEEFPNIKIITITGFPDISFMEKAKACGVNSFLYKNVKIEELVFLIRNTFLGYYVYPGDNVTNDLILNSLNDIELKILRLYIDGNEREDIATKLFMSNSSLKLHVSHILQKTGFSSLARVAIYALSNNLIIPEQK